MSKKMSNFTKVQFDIKKLGLKFNKKKLNSVIFHSTNETREHFLVKCILSYILHSMGHDIYSEGKYGTKKLDVIDLTDMIVYEIETNKTKKKTEQKITNVKDSYFGLIIIDLKDLPEKLDDIFKFVKKEIGY